MVLDKINNSAVFCDFTPKNYAKKEKYAYGIYFVGGQLELRVAVPPYRFFKDEKTSNWLTEVFFPKLFNWTMNNREANLAILSLSYVCKKKYYQLYSQLKAKYAQSLIDVSMNFKKIVE